MRGDTSTTTAGRDWATARFGALVLLVAGLAGLALAYGPDRAALEAAIRHNSSAAPILAIVGSAGLVAVLVPRVLLALVGGALFGVGSGTGYVLLGVSLGAVVAFGIGRLLGRDFVAARLGGRMALIESAVMRGEWRAVMIARLIPVVHFGVSNYAFGTMSTGFRPYVVGTVLGAAPATVAYAALGSAAMRGDTVASTVAGIVVAVLFVGGSAASLLALRWRPARPPSASELVRAPQHEMV
jgi:uncharacterized membrane protein YdjX (TVP38/TMEM64 family)